MKWRRWQYGWGEDLEIKGLPKIVVGHSDIKGQDFYYQFGDIRSKPMFKTIEEAKERVLNRVRQILTDAQKELEPHDTNVTR